MPAPPTDPRFGHGRDSASALFAPADDGIIFGRDGLRAGWGLALFVVLFATTYSLVLAFLAHAHVLPHASPAHAISARFVLLNDGVGGAVVLLLTWGLSRLERRFLASYGFSKVRWLRLLLSGLVLGLLLLILLCGALMLLGLLQVDARLLAPAAAVRSGLLWAAAFLLVAVFEESLLRGYLQATLTRGLASLFRMAGAPAEETLGFWTAAVLLSLLFGASHHGNSGESPLGLVSATLAGLVFCFSLWRTGSLWWAIGFHATWDWAQSFLFGVADSGNMSEGRLLASHPIGRALLSGGRTGPEGSLLVIPVLALACLAVVLTTGAARRQEPSSGA